MLLRALMIGVVLGLLGPFASQALAQAEPATASLEPVPAPPLLSPVPDVVPAQASVSSLPAIPTASPVPPLPTVQTPLLSPPGSGSTAPWAYPAVDQGSSTSPNPLAAPPAPRPGPGFRFHWPPHLPALFSIDAAVGPLFGQAYTRYPAFPATSAGGILGSAVPDITRPTLALESRNADAFAGNAKLALNLPGLSPQIGVNFEFRGGASVSNPQTLDAQTKTELNAASDTQMTVPDVLPTRSLGVFARLLGLEVGYRNLAWSAPSGQDALPDSNLGPSPSANVLMLGYNITLPLGPIQGDFHLALGGGPVSGNKSTPTRDVVSPQEGSLSLKAKIWGIEIEGGVRAESLVFASNPGQLLGLFNLSSLTSQSAGQSSSEVAAAAQSAARLSYTWGPFVQAGVAF